ncbi:hypothetical protein GPJ56_006137 [Histomonas meleagridis]|uniref:uncharacterized protein n=1 Tax=Histomonas meleagridis TaxID=135588 RepID=UPI00355A4C8C|nr:hypothetical protein GPJ56_006137 [Histomonas meleagridis]KAH0797047.1 hypothetical protein GO595_010940 [Histomonas meleagridis]
MQSFLSSPIHIESTYELLRIDIDNEQTILSDKSEILVTEMTFTNCHSDSSGGAIFVISDTYMFCNFSSFSNCSSNIKGGAIYSIIPHLNFTQGCFNNCFAPYGAAIFAPDITTNISIEGSYFDDFEEKDNSTSTSVLFTSARDIVIKSSNFTSISLTNSAAFSLQPTHWLNISHITLSNVVSKNAIASFVNIQPNSPFNYSNIINCKSDSYLITVSNYVQSYQSVVFYKCECTKYFYLNDAKIIVENCKFDKGSSADLTDDINNVLSMNNSTFSEINENDFADLETVITNGCWAHSHYKWKQPKVYVQAIVGVIIALCLVGGFVAIIVHHCLNRKKINQATVVFVGSSKSNN